MLNKVQYTSPARTDCLAMIAHASGPLFVLSISAIEWFEFFRCVLLCQLPFTLDIRSNNRSGRCLLWIEVVPCRLLLWILRHRVSCIDDAELVASILLHAMLWIVGCLISKVYTMLLQSRDPRW